MGSPTEFNHDHSIGDTVKYPDSSRLKTGSIDEIHFHKMEIRGRGEVKYLVVPKGKSKKQGVIRPQDDVMAT